MKWYVRKYNMKENQEYKYCLRCGRQLKNPEAKKLGYGKICYTKIQNKGRKKPLF